MPVILDIARKISFYHAKILAVALCENVTLNAYRKELFVALSEEKKPFKTKIPEKTNSSHSIDTEKMGMCSRKICRQTNVTGSMRIFYG
jgi:hypothetical protein